MAISTLAIAVVTASVSGAPSYATITPTCAPYDGPAFEITGTVENGSTIHLSGYDDIAKASRRWEVTGGSGEGAGSASLCYKSKSNEPSCAIATAGHFVVHPHADTYLIEYQITFRSGTSTIPAEGRLTAKRPRGAPPHDPIFCG